MSEAFTLDSISDIGLEDDLDVAVDSDSYQDQADPAPILAGDYRAKVVSHSLRQEFGDDGKPNGNIKLVDGRFPIIVLEQVEIIEGLDNPRKVGLFQDVTTKPFDRYGTKASGLGDLTRSFDQTRSWRGLQEGLATLREFIEQGGNFVAAYNWTAYDKEFVAAAFEQLGVSRNRSERNDNENKIVNAIYKAAKVRGMNNFPPAREGGAFPSHMLQRENVSFKNPVTNQTVTVEVPHRVIEARAEITRFYPSLEDRKLGSYPYKPRVQAKPVAA